MHLNTTMTDSMLPILSDLAEGHSVSADRWQALQTVPGVAHVAAHGGTPLPVWQSIWEAAARGESPVLSTRQQYILGSDVTVAGFPAANTAALQELTSVGFVETGRPLRMVRGARLDWKPDLLWGRFNGAIG